MLLETPAVERLVEAFQRLPGIGKRSAERLALHLLSAPEGEAENLSKAIGEGRERITTCSRCRNLTESDPCPICIDDRRDAAMLCVVERPAGAMALEKGGGFNGHYYVLNGALNPLEGMGPDELGIERLRGRLKEGIVKEVILATNATAEGEATALYLSRQLTELGIKVSRIAHGVPMGGGLEFTDSATLTHALHGRTAMQ